MPALPFDIDDVNDVVRAQFPGTPPNSCVEPGADLAIASCGVRPNDIRPGGFISGPTRFALIDYVL